MAGAGAPTFVVIGAGAIGGFVGILLHRAGFKVRFLLRSSERSRAQRELLSRQGWVLLGSSNPDFRETLSAKEVAEVFTEDATCLESCSCVLVATKRSGNGAVHRQLAEHGVRCPVLFLQNGLRICEGLEPPAAYEPIECVVHFNTVLDAEAGTITLNQPLEEAALDLDGSRPSAAALAAHISRTPVAASAKPAFRGVQCGKLLLNMTNAVNALSGEAIAPMLMQPSYRAVLAASIAEARAAIEAAGVEPRASRPREEFLLRHFVSLLRAPQWLFAATVGRKLRGRSNGHTSMAQDLAARRVPTEIEFLNGEIVRLGRQHGVPTPVNERLIELVRRAEEVNTGCPCIPGDELVQAVGLPPVEGGSHMLTITAVAGVGSIALLAALLARSARARL